MKKCKKLMVFLVTFAMLMVGLGQTSYGAKDDEDINGATLNVKATVEADSDLGDLDVTSTSDRYTVDSFTFVDAGNSWKPGEIPKVKVVLKAGEGYQFGSKITSNKISIKGNGSCSSIKRLDSGKTLEVSIRLKPVAGTMGEIEDAFWVSTPIGKAKWDQANNASAYQVKLYRNDTNIKTVERTTTNYYDFYSYMTKVGTYYFKVRPIPKSTTESAYLDAGEWQTSDELYIDRTNVAPENSVDQNNGSNANAGGPYDNDYGHPPFGWVQSGNSWWYHENDGSYPINGWSNINNKWYLFDKAGYMLTGWQKWDNKYYYLTVNGDMATGWIEDNKKWYYLGYDGAMQSGWIQFDGNWYYSYVDGARASGWTKLSNKWYYFDPNSGIMVTNTVIGGYPVNGDGVWVQ